MATRAALIVGLISIRTPALAERAALPRILDCSVVSNANWLASGITLSEYEEATGYTIHLNTQSGQWYLSNAYAASLTMGGGNFSVLGDGTDYPHRWIGLDSEGAAQLRIGVATTPPYPFIYLGLDDALMAGTCVEPDQAFIFLDR